MVEYTPEKLEELKAAYAKAKRNPLTDMFEFDGNQYALSYAGYLIEYLKGEFGDYEETDRTGPSIEGRVGPEGREAR
jgi:hypothetical protein